METFTSLGIDYQFNAVLTLYSLEKLIEWKLYHK